MEAYTNANLTAWGPGTNGSYYGQTQPKNSMLTDC
jgi:hypothetical protein